MVLAKKSFNDPRDFWERFEFRFYISDKIICQRYFKINNFNPACLSSYELSEVIQNCGQLIDEDLKDKTAVYLDHVAPLVFKSVKDMKDFFKDESHVEKMDRPGEGIVIREAEAPDYIWDRHTKSPVVAPMKFSDGEFTKDITDEDIVKYKLSFLDNGREVCSTEWEGVYPRFVRKPVDLSNKSPRVEKEIDIYGLELETYLRYKITEGKQDLVFRIIKEICTVCSLPDRKSYTLENTYGDTVYKNYMSERELYQKFVLENDFYKDYPNVPLYDSRVKKARQAGVDKKNKEE